MQELMHRLSGLDAAVESPELLPIARVITDGEEQETPILYRSPGSISITMKETKSLLNAGGCLIE
jgi:hypothetical protein